MYSMIIADDEAIERTALKLLIKRNLPEINILEDAENGIDFLNKAKKLKPDISIIDINMPGIDGLEAIRELKQININTKVIIHSAHNSFQYAQQAVSLGATEYLLKPVKHEKMISLIKKIIESIEIDREKKLETNRVRKAINDVSQTIESDFLSSLMIGDINKGNLLNSYLDILGINFKSGSILTVWLPDSKLEDAKSIRNYIVDCLNNEVENIHGCVSCSIIKNQISLFIRTEKIDEYSHWARNLINNLRHKVKQAFNVDIKVESGALFDNIQSMATLFRENMNSVLNDVDIKRINKIFSETGYKQKFYIFEQNLVKYIESADLENGGRLIEEFVVEMFTGNLDNFKDIASVLLSSVFMRLISKNLFGQKDDFSSIVVHEVASLNSLSEIKQYLYNFTRSLILELDTNKHNKTKKLIKQVIEFINQHYCEDISLSIAAEEIGITPYYLSRLFKQELNENFVDYITNIRIEQVINLMIQDKDRPIKELSEHVGYNNPTYFCKVFKKVTGKTVKDYKKSINQ